MCIAKCLYSYKDDSPENFLKKPAVQECNKSTSGWRALLLLKREEKHPGTRHKTEPVPHDGYDIEYAMVSVSSTANFHLFSLKWFPYFLNSTATLFILNLFLTRRLVEFEVYLNKNGFYIKQVPDWFIFNFFKWLGFIEVPALNN